MDVGAWLRELGLEQYEAAFRENAVDAEVLPTLTADDLKEMGVVPIGHRRRLLDAIAVLRLSATPAEVSARVSSSFALTHQTGLRDTSETTAERRPLSVMFSDLIGSIALSARLDPEDLREVIRSYQACVAITIQQFNGFIARYVGDGVLIYFGWPQAHETDAKRAVRAGLAVAAAVSEAPVSGQTRVTSARATAPLKREPFLIRLIHRRPTRDRGMSRFGKKVSKTYGAKSSSLSSPMEFVALVD